MYISLKYITASVFQYKTVVLAEYSPGYFGIVIFAGTFYAYDDKTNSSCI